MKKRIDKAAVECYEREHRHNLGEALRKFREDRCLTYAEVAKRAQVSVEWLKKLETNRLHTNYSLGRLDRVVRALGHRMFDLYKRTGEMTGAPPWLDEETQDED